MNKAQEIATFTRHELEKEIEYLQEVKRQDKVLIDILWEYVSDKDIDEIYKKLEEYENTME